MAMPRTGSVPFRPRYAMEPSLGATRPARSRRKVDFPDPDLPRIATISPSRRAKSIWSSTSRARWSGVRYVFDTASVRSKGTVISDSFSVNSPRPLSDCTTRPIPCVVRVSQLIEAQALGSEIVEAAPQQPVESEHIQTENADTERDPGAVAFGGGTGDISADTGRGQRCVPPL